MSLNLFRRFTRLLEADAHGVVDSLEDRRLLLKQCLREAEIDLQSKRARLEGLNEDLTRLHEAVDLGERNVQALEDDVTLALSGGKDDLARFAIRRLLPRRHELIALRRHFEHAAAEQQRLAAQIEAQQGKLEQLRRRIGTELAETSRRDATTGAILGDESVRDEEVELELLRRRQGGVL